MGYCNCFKDGEAERIGGLFIWILEKYINVPKTEATNRKIAKDCLKVFEVVTGKKNWNIEVRFDKENPTDLFLVLINDKGEEVFDFQFMTRIVFDVNVHSACSCCEQEKVELSPEYAFTTEPTCDEGVGDAIGGVEDPVL